MQDLRFYLLVEDREKESEVRIDGNLETFRELLQALRVSFPPANCFPTEDPTQCAPMPKGEPHAVTA